MLGDTIKNKPHTQYNHEKILGIILLLLAGISIIADEQQQITEEQYQVTAETLNVRQKPNKHSEIKGKLQKKKASLAIDTTLPWEDGRKENRGYVGCWMYDFIF